MGGIIQSISALAGKIVNFISPTAINPAGQLGKMTAIAVNSSGLYVAVGSAPGTLYPIYATSADGTTWTYPTTMNTISDALVGIAVNSSGLFVAISNFGAVYTSPNGTSWTRRSTISPGVLVNAINFTSIAVNSSGRFIAVGDGISSPLTSYRPFVATSTDGISWGSALTLPTISANPKMHLNAITVDSTGFFVAVGWDEGSYYPCYTTSSDGLAWDYVVRMGYAFAVTMTSIANYNGFFVAVGNHVTTFKAVYMVSHFGTSWSDSVYMGGDPGVVGHMTGVAVSSNGKWVAVGYDASNRPIYSCSLGNGLSWVAPYLMGGSSTPAIMNAVAVNNSGKFVAVGRDNNASYIPVYAVSTGS